MVKVAMQYSSDSLTFNDIVIVAYHCAYLLIQQFCVQQQITITTVIRLEIRETARIVQDLLIFHENHEDILRSQNKCGSTVTGVPSTRPFYRPIIFSNEQKLLEFENIKNFDKISQKSVEVLSTYYIYKKFKDSYPNLLTEI